MYHRSTNACVKDMTAGSLLICPKQKKVLEKKWTLYHHKVMATNIMQLHSTSYYWLDLIQVLKGSYLIVQEGLNPLSRHTNNRARNTLWNGINSFALFSVALLKPECIVLIFERYNKQGWHFRFKINAFWEGLNFLLYQQPRMFIILVYAIFKLEHHFSH